MFVFFTMHHLLLAWTLPFAEICWTVDHRPPFPVFLLHRRPKQPIFLEQAPAWIVRWGWMARETARLENLPQTSGNFRLARWEDSAPTFLSVAGVATWQVSVDLKAHRTKQLDGLEQVCQCVWSPWKKEPLVPSLQLVSTMSRICAQHWVFALKGHVEINLTLSKESYVSKTSLDFLPKIPKSRPVRG